MSLSVFLLVSLEEGYKMETEIWKDIKGFEGLYQVSNLGRVKSVERYIETKNGKKQHWNEKLIASCDNGKGYKTVYLRKNGKTYMKYVHRLVGESFLGNVKSYDINHKDFDRSNNKLSNLVITTRLENIQYSIRNNRYNEAYKKRNKQLYIKKHDELLEKIKRIYDNNEDMTSIRKLEKKYKFDNRTLKRHNIDIRNFI